MGRIMTHVLLGVIALAGCRSSDALKPPPDVFAPWDGTWRGRFFVKDSRGNLLTELDVTQRYWSESPQLQRAEFSERNVKTGEVVTAKATNVREGDRLICRVEKSTGERVEHVGRWTGEALEWSRDTAEARELFRERVLTSTAGETIYLIEGWGEYGGAPRLLFSGRYRRQR